MSAYGRRKRPTERLCWVDKSHSPYIFRKIMALSIRCSGSSMWPAMRRSPRRSSSRTASAGERAGRTFFDPIPVRRCHEGDPPGVVDEHVQPRLTALRGAVLIRPMHRVQRPDQRHNPADERSTEQAVDRQDDPAVGMASVEGDDRGQAVDRDANGDRDQHPGRVVVHAPRACDRAFAFITSNSASDRLPPARSCASRSISAITSRCGCARG